ncbi:hypothetical protein QJS10_CPA03g02464 [Acorus calamus]|uniref:Uncharacterized protein n=1 Tax=Acorus calamus TaxID=4465 RepID=A0AAV9F630_ACOCL|nr:hypothetical protein QJS10_CPA03g02464 [Acorus calamus]
MDPSPIIVQIVHKSSSDKLLQKFADAAPPKPEPRKLALHKRSRPSSLRARESFGGSPRSRRHSGGGSSPSSPRRGRRRPGSPPSSAASGSGGPRSGRWRSPVLGSCSPRSRRHGGRRCVGRQRCSLKDIEAVMFDS